MQYMQLMHIHEQEDSSGMTPHVHLQSHKDLQTIKLPVLQAHQHLHCKTFCKHIVVYDVMSVQELMTPLDAAPAVSDRNPAQLSASPLTCLDGLPQSALVRLCQAGAGSRMPLTVALVSEKARQQAAALDSLAWRDLVAGDPALPQQCGSCI